MSIPTKDLIPGHKYQDDSGDTYIYIGKCIVQIEDKLYHSFYKNTLNPAYVYLNSEDCKIIFNKSFSKNFPKLLKHLTKKSPRRFMSDIGIDSRFIVSDDDKLVTTHSKSGYLIKFIRE